MPQDTETQSEKFKEAARDIKADTDEKRWEERLRRVAKVKDVPLPKKPDLLRAKRSNAKS